MPKSCHKSSEHKSRYGSRIRATSHIHSPDRPSPVYTPQDLLKNPFNMAHTRYDVSACGGSEADRVVNLITQRGQMH